MTGNKLLTTTKWDDDEIVEWDDDVFKRAEIAVGGKIIRESSGTLTKRGRPKLLDPKRQVTLRLDSAVVDGFRAMGPRWQSRINGELRKALGL